MQLDKKTLQKMLALDDARLTAVIRSLAENSGLDLSTFNISPNDITLSCIVGCVSYVASLLGGGDGFFVIVK